ncbi:hypothetical protein ABZ705_01040 [Streptomyces sp. NPDC006984]|uniref:DUF6907 domain-containing protein n=1 Tax=Streptomyces sp. NPDC006984 TaxID=3155463 RepID=UPI0033F22273
MRTTVPPTFTRTSGAPCTPTNTPRPPAQRCDTPTTPAAPAPACTAYSWCIATGPDHVHHSPDHTIPDPHNGGDGYLGVQLFDCDNTRRPYAGFQGSGLWSDLDSAGLRREITRIREHLPVLEALANQLAADELDWEIRRIVRAEIERTGDATAVLSHILHLFQQARAEGEAGR